MDRNIVPCGWDMGNGWWKLCCLGLADKGPAAYAFEEPEADILPSGKFAKLKAFPLQVAGRSLWFGLDILASPVIQEMDDTKYDPAHISILFRAALYSWSQRHKVDLSTLGKLNIVSSMPPGAFADRAKHKQAERAYKAAFNRGQSHFHINGDQIVTQFGGLQRECVPVGSIVRVKETVKETRLVVDMGYGTNDFALFDDGPEPIMSKSTNTGLAHAFAQMDPANPAGAELRTLRNKASLHPAVLTHFSEIKKRIVMICRSMAQSCPVKKIEIIGGGAELMTPPVRVAFKALAPNVIIGKGAEYKNARMNWLAAGGQSEAN